VSTGRPIAAHRLAAITAELLDASQLCAIATVSRTGAPHVNTAYFAWSDQLELVWISAPEAAHSRNIRADGRVAVAVHDSTQTWGNPDRGIQLFGVARELDGRPARRAAELYNDRFPEYDEREFAALRTYLFRPRRVKLFHEQALGSGTFVTARVADGQLAWVRTERYD